MLNLLFIVDLILSIALLQCLGELRELEKNYSCMSAALRQVVDTSKITYNELTTVNKIVNIQGDRITTNGNICKNRCEQLDIKIKILKDN